MIEDQRNTAEQIFAERYGDYSSANQKLESVATDYTKYYDVKDRNSAAFDEYVKLQQEIAQRYIDSLK